MLVVLKVYMAKKTSNKKSGIELPPGLHGLMSSVARMASKLVKDSYAEACLSWIDQQAKERPSIRVYLEEGAAKHPEKALILRQIHIIPARPARVANHR